MGDIGEEAHVHGIDTLLLLLLHLCLTGCTTGMNHATGIAIEIICQGCSEGKIDEPCPPRIGRGRLDHHADGPFVAVNLVAGTVGGAQTEGIVA